MPIQANSLSDRKLGLRFAKFRIVCGKNQELACAISDESGQVVNVCVSERISLGKLSGIC